MSLELERLGNSGTVPGRGVVLFFRGGGCRVVGEVAGGRVTEDLLYGVNQVHPDGVRKDVSKDFWRQGRVGCPWGGDPP